MVGTREYISGPVVDVTGFWVMSSASVPKWIVVLALGNLITPIIDDDSITEDPVSVKFDRCTCLVCQPDDTGLVIAVEQTKVSSTDSRE